jgi:glutamate carboxypeptidase
VDVTLTPPHVGDVVADPEHHPSLGEGAVGTERGLVVVAWALKALAETSALSLLPGLRVVIVSDEEVGSPEGQAVIKDCIGGSRGALVFEAGRKNDLVITRRKGTGAMTVVAHGKAAHAGNAHKEGANALWAIAKLVDRVQGLTDYEKGITVNVGKITGGTSKNTLPDRVEALIDRAIFFIGSGTYKIIRSLLLGIQLIFNKQFTRQV